LRRPASEWQTHRRRAGDPGRDHGSGDGASLQRIQVEHEASGNEPQETSIPPPPSRTNWTRLVPPPVLTGHASSLLPVHTPLSLSLCVEQRDKHIERGTTTTAAVAPIGAVRTRAQVSSNSSQQTSREVNFELASTLRGRDIFRASPARGRYPEACLSLVRLVRGEGRGVSD